MHAIFGKNILDWIVEQIKPIVIAFVAEFVTDFLTPKAEPTTDPEVEPLPPCSGEEDVPTDTADGDVPLVD